jgi:hypothetical protein
MHAWGRGRQALGWGVEIHGVGVELHACLQRASHDGSNSLHAIAMRAPMHATHSTQESLAGQSACSHASGPPPPAPAAAAAGPAAPTSRRARLPGAAAAAAAPAASAAGAAAAAPPPPAAASSNDRLAAAGPAAGHAAPATGGRGGDPTTTLHVVPSTGRQNWPRMAKLWPGAIGARCPFQRKRTMGLQPCPPAAVSSMTTVQLAPSTCWFGTFWFGVDGAGGGAKLLCHGRLDCLRRPWSWHHTSSHRRLPPS